MLDTGYLILHGKGLGLELELGMEEEMKEVGDMK